MQPIAALRWRSNLVVVARRTRLPYLIDLRSMWYFSRTVVSRFGGACAIIPGISSIRRLSGTSIAKKRHLNQSLTDQFPTHLNREIFWALQGIKSGDQGAFHPDQGSPLWRAIWCGFPGTRLSTKSASEFADHITGCH